MENYNNQETMSVEVMQQMLGHTISVVGKNAESIAVMSEKLTRIENLYGGLSKKIDSTGQEVYALQDEVTNLKLNEEVTDEQASTLRNLVHKRASEVLNHDQAEKAKYYQGFIQQCYADMKSKHNMGGKLRTTKKGNYQNVINHIEAWTPSIGMQALKDRIDVRAELKRKAKEAGY